MNADFIRNRHIRFRFFKKVPLNSLVIDIGSGNGKLQNMVRKYRKDVSFYSIDKQDYSANYANKIFAVVDVEKEVIPIGDSTADAVFCSHVIEHMQNLENVLKEMKRVLKPGGMMYIETPSQRSLFLPSFSFMSNTESPLNFYDDATHKRPYTKQSLCRIGTYIGFTKYKIGFARNSLTLILAPVVLLYALITLDKRLFGSTVGNILGLSLYIWAEDLKK